ncbi:MAG: Flp pilus assembly complex ATPase component TadA, partial [Sphingomonadales bacterium]|nr:Flp pilus assembly complex ATPase component TadA [Sphingomonadales bacterium]
EDPVEYQLAGVNQVQVQPNIGFDFARGLRSIVRQDPDVIMVGEIRDLETAEVAVQASLTGHMVLSTLHTNSAIATITRLMDMGVEPYLMASSLNAILAQRLVRRLCPHCKTPIPPTAQHLKWLEGVNVQQLHHPAGCERCQNTGYHGRTVLYEILECTSAITSALSEGANEDTLLKHALQANFTPMAQVGKRLVAQGLTSMEEVLRVTMERKV